MADAGHKARQPVEIYDGELDLKTILASPRLFAVMLVVLAIMWWMSASFKEQEEAKDRSPSPLAEARLDPIPPALASNPRRRATWKSFARGFARR